MTGAKAILDLLVVPRARVRILDQQANGCTGGAPFKHAREDAYRIGLVTLADELRSSGAPSIHITLQVGLGEFKPGRTAVDNAAQRRTVAFAKAGDCEEPAKGISGHD